MSIFFSPLRSKKSQPNCICEYNLGIGIPPERTHWARFEEHNMAPVILDNDGNNSLNHITLVACFEEEIIHEKFGKNAKIKHWPLFPLAQLELTGFECIPIYGTFNITPSRGNHKHQTPHLQDCNEIEFDDTESVNYNEDFDGTNGESNPCFQVEKLTA